VATISISCTLDTGDAWVTQVLEPDELVQRKVICVTLHPALETSITLFFHDEESARVLMVALNEAAMELAGGRVG
jgi:hypothetical protein